MKKYNIVFSSLFVFSLLFAGCSGGGGSSSSGGNGGNSSIVSGTAQLGYISNGDVKIYSLSDLTTPIATTKSSTSLNPSDAGHFSFDNVSLDTSKYYLVSISGGQDIDPNDDGQINAGEAVDLNGTVYSLAKGLELESGNVHINALSDMAYQKLQASLASLSDAEIEKSLDDSAKEYLYDVNDDGKIDNKDLLAFNPVKHSDKTKKSYRDILDIYVPNLHTDATKEEKLNALMYLDKPRIIIKNGPLQEVPFQLETTLDNVPKGTTVKWYVNDVEKTTVNESLTNDDSYIVKAEIYKNNKLLKTLTSQVVATKKVEIASINVDITKDNTVFVTDDSNSSLAGTQVIIPKGALKENQTITIKKSSVNSIPTTDGISLSDIIVMEPSGMQFDKPVQIRIPYDQSIDLTDKNVRIARYSEGGLIDYISPLFIDEDTHEIVFETEHFTEFKAEVTLPYSDINKYITFNDTEDEKFIKTLNNEFNLDYNMDKWKGILNVYIDQKNKKVTVYDDLRTYIENRNMYRIIKGDSKNKHIEALYALYPNIIEASKNLQMWKEIETGFKVIKFIDDVTNSVTRISSGHVYKDLLSKLGIPINTDELIAYASPTPDYIIKTFDKNIDGVYVRQFFNSRNEIYFNGIFDYTNSSVSLALDWLREKNLLWQTESLVRRYESFSPDKDFENAKNAIVSAEAYLKNQLDLSKAKNNSTIKFNPRTNGKIRYKQDDKIHIDYSMTLYGYDRNPSISGKIVDSNDSILIDNIILTCTIDNKVDNLFRQCNGTLYNVNTNKLNNQEFVSLKAYEAGIIIHPYLDTKINIYLQKEIPKIAKVTGTSIQSKLNSSGNFEVDLEGTFDVGSLAHSLQVELPSGTIYTKHFTIEAKDFNNSALENVQVLVTPTESVLKSYDISSKFESINIKAKIDQALAGQVDTTLPSLKIVSVNGVAVSQTDQNDAQTINVGESVTYSIDQSNVETIFKGGLSCSTIEEGIVSGKNEYKCIYNTPNVYTPYMRVVLNNTQTLQTIKAPQVTVLSVGNEAPVVNLPVDTTIYQANEHILLNAEVSDNDGYIRSTKWIPLQNNLTIVNSNSATNAYVIAPLTFETQKEYKFKVIATDDKGAQTTAIKTVKVQGNTSVKRELTFVQDVTLADTCNNYTDSGCSYEITTGDTALKIWEFQNSGDIDFSDGLNFILYNDDTGPLTLGAARLIATSSDLAVGGTIKVAATMNFKDVPNGEYSAKWVIRDKNNNTIKLPNGNEAQMWFKIKLNRAATENDTLSDLLANKTFYDKCGDGVETLIFQNNSKIKSINPDNSIEYDDYSISGDTLITQRDNEEESRHIYDGSFNGSDGVSGISFKESNGYITKLYYKKVDAENAPSNSCDHGNYDGYSTPSSFSFNYDDTSYSGSADGTTKSYVDQFIVHINTKSTSEDWDTNGAFMISTTYTTNDEFSSAFNSSNELYLDPSHITRIALKANNQWLEANENSGTIKLILSADKKTIALSQNGAVIGFNGNYLTQLSMQIFRSNEVHNDSSDTDSTVNKELNWSGKIIFKDADGNEVSVPSSAIVRITPNEEQINNSWGGVETDIDTNGNWSVPTVYNSNNTDISHYTSSNNYQFIVYDSANNGEIYRFYSCSDGYLEANKVTEDEAYVSKGTVSDFTTTLVVTTTGQCID